MPNSSAPYLCGGVVFFLIMQAVPLSATPRERLQGMKDDHAAPIVMSDLVYALTGSYGGTIGKDVSQYRNCEIEGSINVPFNDAATLSTLNDDTLRHYPLVLKRIREFITWHIEPVKYNLLAKMLLDVVENDSEILDGDDLFILANGQPMTRAEIQKESDFHIDALLLGVLHYALVRRCGKNSLGVPTLDLYSDKKAQKRVFNGRAGLGVNRDIHATLSGDDTQDVRSQDQPVQNKKETPQTEQAECDAQDPVEAEVVTDGYIPHREYLHGTGAQINIIRRQTNVVQTGANSVSIANNTGTINISRGSK